MQTVYVMCKYDSFQNVVFINRNKCSFCSCTIFISEWNGYAAVSKFELLLASVQWACTCVGGGASSRLIMCGRFLRFWITFSIYLGTGIRSGKPGRGARNLEILIVLVIALGWEAMMIMIDRNLLRWFQAAADWRRWAVASWL